MLPGRRFRLLDSTFLISVINNISTLEGPSQLALCRSQRDYLKWLSQSEYYVPLMVKTSGHSFQSINSTHTLLRNTS